MIADTSPVIGGRQFAFGMMPPTRAVRVQAVIIKMIGAPIASALGAIGGQKASADVWKQVGAQALTYLPQTVDGDALVKMMSDVFEYCTCEGKRINLDETFMGRPKDLWLAFFGALRVNFADFFPDAPSTSSLGEGATSSVSSPQT